MNDDIQNLYEKVRDEIWLYCKVHYINSSVREDLLKIVREQMQIDVR